MKLLSCEILVAKEPVKDDAFDIWIKNYNQTTDVLFEFSELSFTLLMLKQNGIIRKDKTYFHFTYEWEAEEWFFNASEVFHKMNIKYCFYPPYLEF